MIDVQAFCAALPRGPYAGFSVPLVAAIEAWATTGAPADLARIVKPATWMQLDLMGASRLQAQDDVQTRRLLAALLRLEVDSPVHAWISTRATGGGDGLFASLVADWEAMGLARGEIFAAIRRRLGYPLLDEAGLPTPVGRWLLDLREPVLPQSGNEWHVVMLFARLAPERASVIIRQAWVTIAEDDWRVRLAAALLELDADRWRAEATALVDLVKAPGSRLVLLTLLLPGAPGLMPTAEAAAVAAAAEPGHVWSADGQKPGAVIAAQWLAQATGRRAGALLCTAWAKTGLGDGRLAEAVAAVAAIRNPATTEALRQAALGPPMTTAAAIAGLAALGVPDGELAEAVRGLEGRGRVWCEDPGNPFFDGIPSDPRTPAEIAGYRRKYLSTALAQGITGARRAAPLLVDEGLRWITHEDAVLRRAAARLLAAVPEGLPQRLHSVLSTSSVDVRLAAVSCLIQAGTPACQVALEAALAGERNDDVRDAIVAVLAPSWRTTGRSVGDTEIGAWMQLAGKVLAKPIAKWLDEAALPVLVRRDGRALTTGELRWLCWRQSRQGDIVVDPQAEYLLEQIDRMTSGNCALALLAAYLASKQDAKDRWALTLVGLLGDDRVVGTLHHQIDTWVQKSRGKLAEYAAQALALLESDTALQAVDQVAGVYRTKNRNVGAAAAEAFATAAARRGLTIDELGDAVVPWLGFASGQDRTVPGKKGPITLGVGIDGKLSFRDGAKVSATLPAGAAKEAKEEIKALSVLLRATLKAQTLRHARMLVQQRRWTASTWWALYGRHPALRPFAVRQIWGHFAEEGGLQQTFRMLADGTGTDAGDAGVAIPAHGRIGLVHPLELSESQRAAWRSHLTEHEVEPVVPQLDRPVVVVTEGEQTRRRIHAFAGTALNGMTFKGRADRLGWRRGSVIDGGMISSYVKDFPAAGVEVVMCMDGMFMSMGMEDVVTITHGWFVRAGQVAHGSYVYNEPIDDGDPRVLAFSEVPPIVFSETMGDLGAIAGKAVAGEDDD